MSTKIFENMLGQVMSEVSDTDGHEMIFKSESGKVFKFYHYQDCCEAVSIEDVCGDLSDLVGSPLLIAEEVDNIDTSDSKFHDMVEKNEYNECYQWTFYRFGTAKGTVTVRWLGSSNGYYSTDVDYLEE